MTDTALKSDLLRELHDRGLIYQTTDLAGLDAALTSGVVTGYIGFEPTANSLHIGHLVQLTRLRWLQHFDHRPILLVGGATGKIGDPSDKDEARPFLTQEQLDSNKSAIKAQASHFLTFGDGATEAVLVDNADWLDAIGYLDFLRQVGSHISVNRMLTMDSVRRRLDREQNLSFLEFNYSLLQGYDFVELYSRYGCRLQMGGSEQWSNILTGVDLVRRLKGAEVFGVTGALLTTANGEKMGKTAGNAVWLDATKTSVFDFWQYWRNVEDSDVARFLKIFTALPLTELQRWDHVQGAELNEGKKQLATEVTALVHGRDAALNAASAAQAAYTSGAAAGGGGIDNLPTLQIAQADLATGVSIIDLIMQTGTAGTRSDARRLIDQGGVRLGDAVIKDVNATLPANLFAAPSVEAVLSLGKKRRFRLVTQ
ncbi:MAG: tyrosine--tRNA ligase [Alphaproteobacteria bacterium]|nr:tyrosine--tRNA ligase [Alphaproteobacteria bacterium]